MVGPGHHGQNTQHAIHHVLVADIFQVKTGYAQGCDSPANMVTPDVVLAVGLICVGQNLRVRRYRMVRLDKRFPAYLPVTGDNFSNVQHLVGVFWFPAFKVLGKDAQTIVQRLRLQVHINEHPTAPGIHLYFWQAEIFLIDVGEIPFAGRTLELGLEVPGERVVGAAKFLVVTFVVYQLPAAVQAGISIGFEFQIFSTGDDNGEAGDVLDKGVACLANFSFTAHGLRDPLPYMLNFQFVNFP